MLSAGDRDVLVLAEYLFAVLVPPDLVAVAERYPFAAILSAPR